MKLDFKIVCDCGFELSALDGQSIDRVAVEAALLQVINTVDRHKCDTAKATDCVCGHSLGKHPELAGDGHRLSCGKAGCPCVRYRPRV